MSSTTAEPARVNVKGRHQRSAKNYLLDRRFQLKYTGLLVAIAALLSIVLGMILWKEGTLTVAQGQEIVRRHQQTIEQSRIATDIVKMNIVKEYQDDPELAKIFSEDAQGKEAQLKEEQDRLARDAENLEHRARVLLQVLIAALSILVIGVGLAGIVFTHKVAGPIYKMKRLLRQVGEGQLVVRERLRKGDELKHFFEAFEKMVDDLRARQEAEIAELDEVLEKLAASGDSEEGIALLKKLRARMIDQLEG